MTLEIVQTIVASNNNEYTIFFRYTRPQCAYQNHFATANIYTHQYVISYFLAFIL